MLIPNVLGHHFHLLTKQSGGFFYLHRLVYLLDGFPLDVLDVSPSVIPRLLTVLSANSSAQQ